MKRCFSSSMARTVPALWILTALTGISGPQPARAEDSAAAATPASPATAQAPVQPVFGAIAGVVRSSAKTPIVGAMVTASRADGQGIWTTISGSDGIYSIPNISPGEYRIATQADGYPDTAVYTLQVTAGRATRTDIAMATSIAAQPAVVSSNSSAPAANASVARATQPALAQPTPAPGNSAQSVWPRWLKQMAAPVKPQPAPTTTASLKTPPATAFDKPVADTPDAPLPGPAPQASDSGRCGDTSPGNSRSPLRPRPRSSGRRHFYPVCIRRLHLAQRLLPATKTPCWTRNSSLRKSASTPTSWKTSTSRSTTPSSARPSRSAPVKFRLSRPASAAISTGRTCAAESYFMYGLFATTTPRNDASSATGSSRGKYRRSRPVGSRRRLQVRFGSLRRISLQRESRAQRGCRESSSRTSACSATTISTTGPISRPMCRPIRRGSSTAFAFSGSRPTS